MIKSFIFDTGANKIDVANDSEIRYLDIEGISAISDINSSSLSGYDGATVISSQMTMRNITMVLKLMGGGDKEIAKRRLYTCFPAKGNGTLYIETGTKKVKIECVVEKIEIPPNKFPLLAQVSLLCPYPYFTELDNNVQVMAGIVPLFKFPHTFDGSFKISERRNSVIDNFINSSTSDVYPIIEFSALGTVINPSIMNVNTYEKMKVNLTLNIGDTLTIDTRIGQKSIIKNGTENCFNYMDKDFVFFKLYMGNNFLKYDAESGANNLRTKVNWAVLYGGM